VKRLAVFFVIGLMVASAGFAAAAIGSHGHLFRLLTGTTPTSSTMTSTTPGLRRVTICHWRGSRRNHWLTITVSQSAVPAHLRHGDHLGPCVVVTVPSPTVSVSTTTTTVAGTPNGHWNDSNGHGNGHANDDEDGNPGQSGSSHGNGHGDH
jgi:hypothetical protein